MNHGVQRPVIKRVLPLKPLRSPQRTTTVLGGSERFDPDRLTPTEAAKRHPYAFFPFGGGTRKCVGVDFALTECLLIVAAVLQRCRIRVREGFTPFPEPGVTLRVGGGLPVVIERQSQSQETNKG